MVLSAADRIDSQFEVPPIKALLSQAENSISMQPFHADLSETT